MAPFKKMKEMKQLIFFCFAFCIPFASISAQDVIDCMVDELNDLTILSGSHHVYGNPALMTVSNVTAEPDAQLDLTSEEAILITGNTLFQAGDQGYTTGKIDACVTNTQAISTETPLKLQLQNNPTTDHISANYQLSQTATTQWALFSIDGTLISQSKISTQPPGTYPIEINISHLSSGLYFLTLSVEGEVLVEKVVVEW